MADMTVTVPDAFLPRLVDPVNYRATNIEDMPVVQKILTAWGEPTVAGLTTIQKGELCCLLHLWQLVQQKERSTAGNAATAVADQAVLDDFNP
jgi:hypothetical protein